MERAVTMIAWAKKIPITSFRAVRDGICRERELVFGAERERKVPNRRRYSVQLFDRDAQMLFHATTQPRCIGHQGLALQIRPCNNVQGQGGRTSGARIQLQLRLHGRVEPSSQSNILVQPWLLFIASCQHLCASHRSLELPVLQRWRVSISQSQLLEAQQEIRSNRFSEHHNYSIVQASSTVRILPGKHTASQL